MQADEIACVDHLQRHIGEAAFVRVPQAAGALKSQHKKGGQKHYPNSRAAKQWSCCHLGVPVEDPSSLTVTGEWAKESGSGGRVAFRRAVPKVTRTTVTRQMTVL
jgi:hypothetical protein